MDVRLSSARIARSIMDMKREGRIAMSRASTQAITMASEIIAMDDMLGDICEACLHEHLVPQMAERAFAIGGIVKELDRRGLVDLVDRESDMFAPEIAEAISCGFTLVVDIVA